MPIVREQIDRMSVSDKMQTLEYLWSSMAAAVVAQPPAWHAAILPSGTMARSSAI